MKLVHPELRVFSYWLTNYGLYLMRKNNKLPDRASTGIGISLWDSLATTTM
jgi:hypothetical protein